MGLRARVTAVVVASLLALDLTASTAGATNATATGTTTGTTTGAAHAAHPAGGSHPLAVPAAGYGFVDGMGILALGPSALDRELDAVDRTGGRWIRLPINWAVVEPRPGVYRWGAEDRLVRAARAHHLTVLADITNAPTWARTIGTATAPPRRPRTFAAFVKRAVLRYRGTVHDWEIWNEPNLSDFFGGAATHARAPEIYTHLLRAAYVAVKSVQPRSKVLAGALSSLPTSSSAIAATTFVSRMYAAGAARHFDVLSLHPYVTGTPRRNNAASVFDAVADVRAQMVRHGDGRKRIWFTELGFTTWVGGLSASQQVTMTVDELALAALRPYVGPTFLYSIRDSGTNPLVGGQHFGTLLTYAWRPKGLARVLAPGYRTDD